MFEVVSQHEAIVHELMHLVRGRCVGGTVGVSNNNHDNNDNNDGNGDLDHNHHDAATHHDDHDEPHNNHHDANHDEHHNVDNNHDDNDDNVFLAAVGEYRASRHNCCHGRCNNCSSADDRCSHSGIVDCRSSDVGGTADWSSDCSCHDPLESDDHRQQDVPPAANWR